MIDTEGLYLAIREGYETLIIKVEGVSPMLEITSAINLTTFAETGEVKGYKAGGQFIKDIAKNPESYLYKRLVTTETIAQKKKAIEVEMQIPEKEFTEYLKYYRENGRDKIKLLQNIFIKRNMKLNMSQCEEIAETVIEHHKTVIEYVNE